MLEERPRKRRGLLSDDTYKCLGDPVTLARYVSSFGGPSEGSMWSDSWWPSLRPLVAWFLCSA